MSNASGRRGPVNLFIACLLILLLIDGLPSTFRAHTVLKERTDALLDATGLWQGSWNLFAPDPTRQNTLLTAKVRYADGYEAYWRSPEWREMPAGRKFVNFRYMEYLDDLPWDYCQEAWPSFAEHLARTLRPAELPPARPREVILERHAGTIPPPVEGEALPRRGEIPYSESKVFYRRRYP